MKNQNILLSSYHLSSKLPLKNRIVMAPMTRRFSSFDHIPSKEMIGYYARRADAGLIVTEGTLISEDAIGYGNVPGIFTDDHVNAWKKITNEVHKHNGLIFLQLWHCGRISHSSFHRGNLPISASATQANVVLGSTKLPCSHSREASINEIEQLISQYTIAAKNAIIAGFDGVELHGANGYLIDQFLHYCTNKRSDNYGGSPENMARFVIDLIKACGQEIGYEKIGLRISPAGHMNEIIADSRDKFVFSYLLDELNSFPIAYVHTGAFDDSIIYSELDNCTMTQFINTHYDGTIIASGGYGFDAAIDMINKNHCSLIAFGRLFLANHDLISIIKNDIVAKQYDQAMLQNIY